MESLRLLPGLEGLFLLKIDASEIFVPLVSLHRELLRDGWVVACLITSLPLPGIVIGQPRLVTTLRVVRKPDLRLCFDFLWFCSTEEAIWDLD